MNHPANRSKRGNYLKQLNFGVSKLAFLFASGFFSQSFGAMACPKVFFDLPLPSEINTCTTFTDTIPAALSFHSPSAPDAIMQFYATQTLTISSQEKHVDRFVLIAQNQQYRIIISPDKQGSQIDLLHLNQ